MWVLSPARWDILVVQINSEQYLPYYYKRESGMDDIVHGHLDTDFLTWAEKVS